MVTFWGKSILLFHFVKLSRPLLQQSKSSEMTHQETPRKSNEGLFGCVLSALNIVILAWLNYMNYIVYLKANSPTRMNWSRHILNSLIPIFLTVLNRTEQTFKITVTIYLHETYTYIHPSFSRFNRFVFTHQYSAPPFGRKISDKNKIRDGYYISGIQLMRNLTWSLYSVFIGPIHFQFC